MGNELRIGTIGRHFVRSPKQSKHIKVALKLAHHAMDVLPGVLLFHLGWVANVVTAGTERKRILLVKPTTANATGVPSESLAMLAMSMLVPVSAFPAGLGVVIVDEREQTQPKSHQQSNQPAERRKSVDAMTPESCDGGTEHFNNKLEKDWEEAKQ